MTAAAPPPQPSSADMAGAADDRRLLNLYVSRRSGAAFGELVRRHTPLVYGLALRKTRDAGMAEDVAQTVFCLLARKAASLRSRPLSGWLFAATRYAAANALRATVRRKRHERAAARPEEVAGRHSSKPELSYLLDDALARLSRADREVVLLRYFDGLEAGALAGALGLTEQAARRRLARAIQRLRRCFAAAGVSLSAAGISAAATAGVHPVGADADRIARTALAPPSERLEAIQALARSFRVATARAFFPALALALLVLFGAAIGGRELRRLGAIRNAVVAPTLRPRRPNLQLTFAWSGQSFTIPMPPTFPEELRQTPAYREWEAAGDARSLDWTTRDGRKYVCWAEVRNVDGRTVAYLASVRLFRADGTLEAETTYDPYGDPLRWEVFGPDGKTREASFAYSPRGTPGGRFVRTIWLYHADKSAREYEADADGSVYAEWLLDGQGRRVRRLNGAGRPPAPDRE
jgi:RNA polymerase sigma factor (sigma-70 family)